MIASFMRFLDSELEHRRNFELVESLLTVFLRVCAASELNYKSLG